jgi:two-component system LytT family sensor kinase
MVQPLVENAVRHGLEPKIEGGSLSIKARMRKGNLILWILDDGVGISQERLAGIRTSIAATLSRIYERGETFADAGVDIPANTTLLEGTGIGLANLATRFGILYGGNGRFDIVSRLDRGTLVRVVIPMEGVSE